MNKPRYEYRCAVDGASVTKKPVSMTPAVKKGAATFSGLHGWTCSLCGHGPKVARKLS